MGYLDRMLVVASNIRDRITLDGDDLVLPWGGKVRPWLDDEANRTKLYGEIKWDLMFPLLPLDREKDMLSILVGNLLSSLSF